MAGIQLASLKEMPGFDHRPDWYRPLLFGETMHMDVTYLLPGLKLGLASMKGTEGELLEQAIYMLEGRLELTYGGKTVDLLPHMALSIPALPESSVEVKNTEGKTASFIRVFSPPPHPDLKIHSLERLTQLYNDAKRAVKTPAEIEDIIALK